MKAGPDAQMCVEWIFHKTLFFDEAKKEPWLPIPFCFVADHTNQIFYDEYTNLLIVFCGAIILYKPTVTMWEDTDFAQQIDIFPTIWI
jgi:hypothetical protein